MNDSSGRTVGGLKARAFSTSREPTGPHCLSLSAARHGLQVLVESAADVNATDHRLRTALHMAATAGHTHVVSKLAELGGNVAAHDAEGFTPLHWAASMGHVRPPPSSTPLQTQRTRRSTFWSI